MNPCRLPLIMVVLVALSPPLLQGQQAGISTPMTGVSDSFYEQIGSNWGFHGGGFFFNFGGPNPGLPPLGLGDPGGGARFGFGGRLGNGRFSWNGFASQGSDRSLVSTTPTIVVPNGGVGSIANVLQRPFVTGVVPVVGRRDMSPLLERLERLRQQREVESPGAADSAAGSGHEAVREPRADRAAVAAWSESERRSTAVQGDLSVAEIRRQREAAAEVAEAERRSEVQQWLERGRECEVQGKLGAARVYYQNAARQAQGSLREQLLAKIRELNASR